MMVSIFLFPVAIGYFIFRAFRSRIRRMRLLEDNNIPGPRPNLFSGSMIDYMSTPNVTWDSKMIDTYGPICGYYIGAKPVILIADPDLAKHIQQFQVKNYLERPRRVPGGINPDRMRAKMLGNLPVSEWKSLRRTLSKCFSTGMMKSFTPTINRLVDELMNQLNDQVEVNQQRVEIDIYPFFQAFTFELISQTGFGVHANFNGDNDLREAVAEEFSKNTSSWLTKFFLCLPELGILQRIRIWVQWCKTKLGKTKCAKLRMFCDSALQKRKNDVESFKSDILSVMLNSPIMDDEEKVLANSILFYEAAYETLSAGLAFTMHLLTNNPNVQQKVREEIRKYMQQNDGHILADNISQLKYLDAVIKESLRMHPPQTTFISRSGEVDFVYRKDEQIVCTIPKGVQVQIGLYQMHNCPKFWNEPEVFKPERHFEDETKNNLAHDFMYQPFGKGQRRCIGYSYAKLVMPLVLATILSKYTFAPSPKTERTITLLFKTATMTPKNGCFGEMTYDPIVF